MAQYQAERTEFENALLAPNLSEDDDPNLLRRFSHSLAANTLLSQQGDVTDLKMPYVAKGVHSGNMKSNLELYVEEPELLLVPLNQKERQRVRKMFDTVTRRMRKAQTMTPPADVAVKLAGFPREYVGDAVLRYQFDEWHVVRSHHTDVHPGGHRCSLTVHVPDLRLSVEQEDALVGLAGHRYNDRSRTLKLVSRKYLDKVQNRIHARLLLDRLLVAVGAAEPAAPGQQQGGEEEVAAPAAQEAS